MICSKRIIIDHQVNQLRTAVFMAKVAVDALRVSGEFSGEGSVDYDLSDLDDSVSELSDALLELDQAIEDADVPSDPTGDSVPGVS